jgi:glycerol-3-phosphate dehydrogenase (NAD(P)+)
MKVVILGAGVMGTALTVPLADNGHDVRLVGTHLDGDIIEEIQRSHRHPRHRTPVPASVKPYPIEHLDQAIQGVDLIIIGVSSLGIEWAAEVLGPLLATEIPLVTIAKGMRGDSRGLHILPDIFRAGLPESYREGICLASIGGPSIAGELAARMHTSIVLAGDNKSNLEGIAAILRTPYYHVWTSTDIVGVEICVALKDLYAVGAGLVYGWLEKQGSGDYGATVHNPVAAIFAQGLWETAYLIDYMGGDLSSVYTLPGAGDAFVTCVGGRNMQMGRWMSMGMTYKEAKSRYKPNETVEGPQLAISIGSTIRNMVNQGELEGDKLPLLNMLIDIVCDDKAIEIPWDCFFR